MINLIDKLMYAFGALMVLAMAASLFYFGIYEPSIRTVKMDDFCKAKGYTESTTLLYPYFYCVGYTSVTDEVDYATKMSQIYRYNPKG